MGSIGVLGEVGNFPIIFPIISYVFLRGWGAVITGCSTDLSWPLAFRGAQVESVPEEDRVAEVCDDACKNLDAHICGDGPPIHTSTRNAKKVGPMEPNEGPIGSNRAQ